MIIDVDMGNTRIKWRTSLAPDQLVAHSTYAEAKAAWSMLPGVTRVRIAAVVAPSKVQQLKLWCRSELSVEPEVAAVADGAGDVSVAYKDPSALGVDRWLSMLAARRCCPGRDLVVASVGTALTFDYIDAQGNHRGGYIMPGVRLAAEALLGGTDRIRCANPEVDADITPGRSTQACVDAGLSLMYRGAVESAIAQDLDRFDAATLMVTGGDGKLLVGLQRTRIQTIYDPLLVLRGLEIALP